MSPLLRTILVDVGIGACGVVGLLFLGLIATVVLAVLSTRKGG